MNTLALRTLRPVFLAAFCLILSSASRAADQAAEVLAAHGAVDVSNVGPSVRTGATKDAIYAALGNADAVLADGSWLFRKPFYVDHSAATGSLVVSFSRGKVRTLRIVSPFEAVAMVSRPDARSAATLVASVR